MLDSFLAVDPFRSTLTIARQHANAQAGETEKVEE
jgi:hypothetical protein